MGSYNDWHPPAMAWFWSVLILITGQIESLMIFHLLILAGGAFYWARILEHIGCGVFAFIIPVILASPVIVNFSGVIWKDVGFAYVLLLASGIAGVAILNKRIYSFQFLAIVFLLAYGFGVRSNGIFAIIPIVIFVAWLMIAKANSKLSKIDIFCRISISTIAFVAILIVGMQYCVYDLLGSEKRYPIQYLELYDIAGVSSISKYDFFPEYVRQAGGYSIYRIKEEYEKSISVYGNANNIFFSSSADGAPPLILLNVDAVLQTQLRNSWLEAIIAEPIAYLKHRLSVFSFLMEKGFYSHEMPQDDASRVSVLKANMLDLKIIKFKNIHFPGVDGAKRFVLISFLWSQGAYIYNGWVWLSLLLVEFFLGLTVFGKTSLGRIVVMTSSSGLLYLLPYFIVAPASDFRYLYWTSIAASFTFLLVFAYVMKLLTRLISWQYVGLAKG